MPTLEPTEHSPESITHWGCLKQDKCCGCFPHENCGEENKNMKNDKQLNNLVKLQNQIRKIGEDKLNSILFRGLLQHFVTEAIDYDLYLLRTKNKAHKRFQKVIKIIHENQHLI